MLAGCSGNGIQPKAALPPGPIQVVAANPIISGSQAEARLIVRINVNGQSRGLQTQTLPATFDHAIASLSGPLLQTSPRALNITAANFPAGSAVVTTLAGSDVYGFADGTGTAALFNSPPGVAVDSSGNVYVADGNNRIRKIDPAGVVTTVAGSSQGSADGTGTAATFNQPSGVAIYSSGNVYVADMNNNRIRKIDPAGVVTTLAGSSQGFANGTGTAALFNGPSGVAVDSSGNVYVADYINHRIRKVTPAGVVTTLAGSTQGFADGTGTAALFSYPYGVAVDSSGNVYVTDRNNQRIRKVSPAGAVTTLAGSSMYGFADGTGTAALFNNPSGVTVDSSGNVYVSDNKRIRKISPAGVVTTLAGSGTEGFADGTGTAALFFGPDGVAVGSSGNIYVADRFNHRIRKLTIPPPTATGVFQNLRPGGGYELEVALYDNATPANRVLAAGETPSIFSLIAGTNLVTVTLDLSSAITLPLPLPLTFSIFDNSTANATGQPTGTVVVLGDTLQILPGVGDPNGQLRAIGLWLDGTAAANFLDGQLLALWRPDGFSTPLSWDTGTTHTPVVIGTAPTPAPTPSPNPFVSPSPTTTPSPSPSPVPPPSAVSAEGTPNHTLSFTLHSRFSAPGNDLIKVVTYNLTVLNPASLSIGIQSLQSAPSAAGIEMALPSPGGRGRGGG